MSLPPTDRPTPPSVAVVERVAKSEEVSPLDLEPLYFTIDPDALDSLFVPGGPANASARVVFAYEGYEVTVTGDGVIHLEQAVEAELTAA